jgi:hypothetical protein
MFQKVYSLHQDFDKGKGRLDNRHIFKFLVINWRVEGLAKFHELRNAKVITLSGDDVAKMRKNVQKLVYSFHLNWDQLMRTWQEFFHKDRYYAGYHICVIIALANHKRSGVRELYLKNGQQVDFKSLNSMFKQNAKIKNVSDEIIEYTIGQIYNCDEEEFIHLYEKSCRYLRIQKRYRLIWWSLYQQWNKIIFEERKKYLGEHIKKRGFQPTESGMRSLMGKLAEIFKK